MSTWTGEKALSDKDHSYDRRLTQASKIYYIHPQDKFGDTQQQVLTIRVDGPMRCLLFQLPPSHQITNRTFSIICNIFVIDPIAIKDTMEVEMGMQQDFIQQHHKGDKHSTTGAKNSHRQHLWPLRVMNGGVRSTSGCKSNVW